MSSNTHYLFEKPLQEGILLKRNSQFTMDVLLDGVTVKCHCPTTGRIGDVDTKNIACLVSKSEDIKRKLPYTVEAVSCDNLEHQNKNWIGINQILSNRLVEYFINTHQLDSMVSDYGTVHREVNLGVSKLDFLVGNTYMEVKTPLTTLHVKYGSHIKTKPITPFSSTERFTKHIHELAGSLQSHERAILLTVHQYIVTQQKPHQASTNYQEVSEAMQAAKEKGLEVWNLDMRFTPQGVFLYSCTNTTNEMRTTPKRSVH